MAKKVLKAKKTRKTQKRRDSRSSQATTYSLDRSNTEGLDAEATEKDAFNGDITTSCQHHKVINTKRLTKGLNRIKNKNSKCGSCDKPQAPPSSSTSPSDTESKEQIFWICLSCAQLSCDRGDQDKDEDHALEHHKANEQHFLAINAKTFNVWCYGCNKAVVGHPRKNQHVLEAQRLTQKFLQPKASNWLKDQLTLGSSSSLLSRKKESHVDYKILAPGLSNLGNTCYFNSTLQVIASTEILHEYMRRPQPSPGPLNEALSQTMRALWTHDGRYISPSGLFDQVTKKFRQFRGHRQQDAHELMRYLLDGLLVEELEAKKKRIVANAGRKNVGKEKKRKEKEGKEGKEEKEEKEGKEGKEVKEVKDSSLVNGIFGGKLVSLVVCDTCKDVSYSYEDFLDISLPIKIPGHDDEGLKDRKIPRISKHLRSAGKQVSSFIERSLSPAKPGGFLSRSPSPTENSKDPVTDIKQAADDNAGSESLNSGDDMISGSDGESLLRQSTAAVGEGEIKHVDTPASNSLQVEPENPQGSPIPHPSPEHQCHIDRLLATNYSVVKHDAPTLVGCLQAFTDVEVLDDENKLACDRCWKLLNPEKVRALEKEKMREKAKEEGRNDEEEEDREEEEEEEKKDNIEEGLTKGHLENGDEMVVVFDEHGKTNAKIHRDDEDDLGSKFVVVMDEEGHVIEDNGTSIKSTLSKSSGDATSDISSVITAVPSLVTEPPTSDKVEGKTLAASSLQDSLGNTIPLAPSTPGTASAKETRSIFRKGIKRFLLQQPLPPVLVLHLKRFQQTGSRYGSMKKIDDWVEFPETIDLAEFVAPTRLEEEEERHHLSVPGSRTPSPESSHSAKYRLYGVVVHMGNMYGGHYVAYVLSKRIADRIDKVEIPDLSLKEIEESKVSKDEGKISQEDNVPRREWIFCSDTSVRQSSLEEVLQQRAYIMFYEKL